MKVRSKGRLKCGVVEGTVYQTIPMSEYTPMEDTELLIKWCSMLGMKADELMASECCFVRFDPPVPICAGAPCVSEMGFPACELEAI